ncbi:MAG: pilus assembly protein [bacterium]|nr:pilus assembly protein [bacterium]
MIEKTPGRAGRSASRFRALRRSDGERGAALIEAAILMPLVIMLIFGLIAFGRAYNAKVTATHAAREGVRVLAVTGDNTAGETAASNAAAGLDVSNLTVSSTACTPGDPTTLTVNYVFTYQIPVFGDRTVNISETGVMRCGG